MNKKCKNCHIEKPLDAFPGQTTDIRIECIECQEEIKKWFSQNIEAIQTLKNIPKSLMFKDGKKLCKICREYLPTECFTPREERPSRYVSVCKSCTTKKRRAYVLLNPEQYKNWNQQTYLKNKDRKKDKVKKSGKLHRDSRRAEVIATLGGKCACCGEVRIEFLVIDHINNDGRIDRANGFRGYRMYTKVMREGYPKDKYQVLCHNCNNSRGFYGYCPHTIISL